jgi:uracil-DNA glycosylase
MSIKSLDPDWSARLQNEFSKPYFNVLAQNVNQAYLSGTVYPPAQLVFNALNLCPLATLKVVIIGQDPYHGEGQAHGLSFSVNDGVKFPPSLQNIFKELVTDIPGFTMPLSGNLEPWAYQGVLLLNASLTVNAASPGSHKNFGWELFTDAVIKVINDEKKNVVFMLWGNFALGKAGLIDASKHLVLKAAHPSPLARGAFFGCRHFSKANAYLSDHGIQPIDWKLK